MQQVDFSSGSVRRSILAVAAPMMAAQILNLLYNIVDRIYIGKIPRGGDDRAGRAGAVLSGHHAGDRVCQPVRRGRRAAVLDRASAAGDRAGRGAHYGERVVHAAADRAWLLTVRGHRAAQAGACTCSARATRPIRTRLPIWWSICWGRYA